MNDSTLPVIVLAGFSCVGKSTVSKRLIDLYSFDLMDQNLIYHEISASKGYKRTRYWLAAVGNEGFVCDTTLENIRRIKSLQNSRGVLIDASYGPVMHDMLVKGLPEAKIVTIAITTVRAERVLRMMGRMSASFDEADTELSFRDSFLSEVGLQTIINGADLQVENMNGIEVVIMRITQKLTELGINPISN